MRCHGGIQVALATRERPRLARLLGAFALSAQVEGDCREDFKYTTIQVNFNYEAALHARRRRLSLVDSELI